MILAAVAKLGFIADLISKPTMIGYMNGLALTILVGQLPKLFGFKVDADGLIGEIAGFAKGLAHGEAVAAAAAVGIAAVVLILVLQRWLPKVPAVLIAVVAAIAATSVFDLAGHGVSLVGVLPKGFPPLTIPHVRLSDLGPLFAGAAGIALVSLADTISTSSAFAARTGQEVHGNGEMIGIGAANLAARLFQGFPVSTSGSRTAVAERSGAKTQLTGVTGAALIVLMIVLVPGLFKNLPQPALAAVVITASLSLADIPATVRLWRQRKAEFLLSIAAFARRRPARRAARHRDRRRPVHPERLPAGLVALRHRTRPGDGLEGYHDVHSYPEARHLPGLVIYRFDGPLFFANAKTFRDEVSRMARADPKPDLDPGRRRADHRRGHHRLRHARRPRRGAERPGHQPGLRRAQGPGPAQDRTLRPDPHHRPGPLLPHHRSRRRRLPRRNRRPMDRHRPDRQPSARHPDHSAGSAAATPNHPGRMTLAGDHVLNIIWDISSAAAANKAGVKSF